MRDELEPLDILLVEDEPHVRESMSEVLAHLGHRVTASGDGAHAMGQLDRRNFDLAFCDVRLPKVDGMTLLRRLRRDSPDTYVVMMTSFATVDQAVSAMKERAAEYLEKPVTEQAIVQLVDRIAADRHLHRQLSAEGLPQLGDSASTLMGSTPAMVRIRKTIAAVGASDSSVMLTGESGSGKELVARQLHAASRRASGPFVAVNCAAFPDGLLEAEMFGHERGAFTGAHARRDGRFQAAHRGTLFLDEVAEMPLAAQAKLLRVLEERRVARLGSNTLASVDVRIISATNLDIREAVAAGRFREDIYHRLKVFHIHIPPLRERRGDLPALLNHFYRQQSGPDAPALRMDPRAWAALKHHPFPGNVRELMHVVEHARVLSGGGEIGLEHLPEDLRVGGAASAPLNAQSLGDAVTEFERDFILRTLQQCHGKKQSAADQLGISRKTLWKKLRTYRDG